ncbi:DUF2066 domain-containing protein [Alkalilimnicola sp. S0819]|uniref:DUF2066 domain-containing protein n=1 Tax=Alkalilimnicola sp. S0819 TaxID=2613922 RepID=UPI001D01DA9F|nr:DUF2066 domain-containing protein [Alkalilimnicola sp. S0819]
MIRKLCLLCLLWPLTLGAQSLFDVRVPVANGGAQAREQAMPAALEQVLARLTGQGGLAADERLRDLLPRAGRYVQRYSYEQGEDDAPPTLRLSFDDRALRAALAERQVPVWQQGKPAVLAWVAVEQGRERDLLGGEDDPALRQAMREAARDYGLALLFPLLDLEDRRSIRVSDVWGGFADSVLTASRRYEASAVLSARLNQDRAGRWQGAWRLYLGGEAAAAWQSRGESAQGALADGMRGLAQGFAARYAVVPGQREERLRLRVEAVSQASDYAWLQQRLAEVPGVSGVGLARAEGRDLEFELALDLAPERVLGTLDRVPWLRRQEVQAGGTAGVPHLYRLSR